MFYYQILIVLCSIDTFVVFRFYASLITVDCTINPAYKKVIYYYENALELTAYLLLS